MLSRLAYSTLGILVVALSFSVTLFTLNRWSGDPRFDPLFTASIRSALPLPYVIQETTLDALPRMNSANFRWTGITHLNAQSENEKQLVGGQPIIRLIATSQDSYHFLAGQFSGLNKDRVYRVTAWTKSEGNGNLYLEIADQGGAQHAHYAQALFDLSDGKVLRANGSTEARGIDQEPDNWEKVWLDLTTSDGQIVVALRPANGSAISYAGDGHLGLILGGIQADPKG